MFKKRLIIFMPTIDGGGVEKNLFIVSNHLVKKINDISIITTSKSKVKKFNKDIKIIAPKRKFWENASRKLKYLISFFILINEILKNKEIVVFSFQANLYCVLLCKLFSVKIIIRSNFSPTGWSDNFYYKYLYKFFLKKADSIIVNSKEFKAEMKKKFDIETECILNPLNKKEIIKLSRKKVKPIYSRKSALKIINVGRLVYQKNQIILLKALNLLKDKINFELVIMGRGNLKNTLEEFISKNNLSSKIKIIDYTENPYRYMKQADVVILTSKFEGLPNVLLEALVLNKFVISSKCPTGPKEILLNGKIGLLFNQENYKELSKKILYFSNKKSSLIKKSKKYFFKLKRYDYNVNLNKYFKLVNNFL